MIHIPYIPQLRVPTDGFPRFPDAFPDGFPRFPFQKRPFVIEEPELPLPVYPRIPTGDPPCCPDRVIYLDNMI
jgi:hypothetical protein